MECSRIWEYKRLWSCLILGCPTSVLSEPSFPEFYHREFPSSPRSTFRNVRKGETYPNSQHRAQYALQVCESLQLKRWDSSDQKKTDMGRGRVLKMIKLCGYIYVPPNECKYALQTYNNKIQLKFKIQFKKEKQCEEAKNRRANTDYWVRQTLNENTWAESLALLHPGHVTASDALLPPCLGFLNCGKPERTTL